MIEAYLPEPNFWWLALSICIVQPIADKAWAFAAEGWPILVVAAILGVVGWALSRWE